MTSIKLYKIVVVCFVLTFNACDRNNLVSVTAKDVLDIAKFEKGKRAVLINVWATCEVHV